MSGGLRQVQAGVSTQQKQIENIGGFINKNLIPITEMNRTHILEAERGLRALELRVGQDEEDICRIGDRFGLFITMTFWEKFKWFFFGAMPAGFYDIGHLPRPVAAPIATPDTTQREMPPPIVVEGKGREPEVSDEEAEQIAQHERDGAEKDQAEGDPEASSL